jgi:hypothetical protein
VPDKPLPSVLCPDRPPAGTMIAAPAANEPAAIAHTANIAFRIKMIFLLYLKRPRNTLLGALI